jgi:hypothetical protein
VRDKSITQVKRKPGDSQF